MSNTMQTAGAPPVTANDRAWHAMRYGSTVRIYVDGSGDYDLDIGGVAVVLTRTANRYMPVFCDVMAVLDAG